MANQNPTMSNIGYSQMGNPNPYNYGTTPSSNYYGGNSNPNANLVPSSYAQNTPLTRPSYLSGRMVNSEEDVVFMEVPMDGSYSFFVQQDFQKIYAKTIGSDGRIITHTFQLTNETSPDQEKEDPMQELFQRLDRIEGMLKRPSYPNNRKPNYNKSKPYQNKKKEALINE